MMRGMGEDHFMQICGKYPDDLHLPRLLTLTILPTVNRVLWYHGQPNRPVATVARVASNIRPAYALPDRFTFPPILS